MRRNGKVGVVYAVMGKNIKTGKEDFYRCDKDIDDEIGVLSCSSCEPDMLFLSYYSADYAIGTIKKLLADGNCDVDLDSLTVVEFPLILDNAKKLVY